MDHVKSGVEVRNVETPVSLREGEVAEGGDNRLVGYAAMFNVESGVLYDEEIGLFIETIAPGAFKRTLVEQPDIRALYNHDTSLILGRTKAGTLSLSEDEKGLAFDLLLPDTQYGRDVRESVRRGDIDGCSFGFCVREDDIEFRKGLPALRTLLDVELYEVSPAVAFPAYEATSVSLRHRPGLVRHVRGASTPRLDHARRRLLLDSI